jgi:hypothetical protein
MLFSLLIHKTNSGSLNDLYSEISHMLFYLSYIAYFLFPQHNIVS